jgi:hypothetical protein
MRKSIMEDKADFFDDPDEERTFSWMHYYYIQSVMEYTHRGMTKFTDRLIAISGINSAIIMRTKNRYLAGLWFDHLAYGLTWSISRLEEFTPSMPGAINIPPGTRPAKPIAPSWSWASVQLPIIYSIPEITQMDSICRILAADVQGPADTQTGYIKLEAHTRRARVKPQYQELLKVSLKQVEPPLSTTEWAWLDFQDIPEARRAPQILFLASFETSEPGKWCPLGHVRGTFRPDELLDPSTVLTFVALTQMPHRKKNFWSLPDGAADVFTIALVPTQNSETAGSALGQVYRRVGYARWSACSWYGYNCTKVEAKDGRRQKAMEMTRRILRRPTKQKQEQEDPELYRTSFAPKTPTPNLVPGTGVHQHPITVDIFPDMTSYHSSVMVEKKTITII